MRRVGATRIYTSSANFLHNYVVEIDGRRVIGYHPLTHETPMTEWLQGIIVICDIQETDTNQFTNIADFFNHPHIPGSPLKAWHITDVDYTTGAFDETPHRL